MAEVSVHAVAAPKAAAPTKAISTLGARLMMAIVAPCVATPTFTDPRSPPPSARIRRSTRPTAAPTPNSTMSTPNSGSLALSTSRT